MPYECRVERDSVSPAGVRLTTFVVTFPRFILAEFNTHRMLSRNAASSRAIPVGKRLRDVSRDPFVPQKWGANQPGMQAGEELDEDSAACAEDVWRRASLRAVGAAAELMTLGVHKQLANRLLEPFSWVTVIASATEWSNFFALRCHPAAQPEFHKIAAMMQSCMSRSTPEPLGFGEWHLPLVYQRERDQIPDVGRLKLISAGRCARVSYLTHDGREDYQADVDLAERLIRERPPHASPFEHVATPAAEWQCVQGNFRGWHQYRHAAESH